MGESFVFCLVRLDPWLNWILNNLQRTDNLPLNSIVLVKYSMYILAMIATCSLQIHNSLLPMYLAPLPG